MNATHKVAPAARRAAAPRIKPRAVSNPAQEIPEPHFPAVVMGLGEKLHKVPIAFWYENDGRTIAIQWSDLSKDRFDAG